MKDLQKGFAAQMRAKVDPVLLNEIRAAQERATVDPGLLKAFQQGFAAQMHATADSGLLKALKQGFAAQMHATADSGLLKALKQGFAAHMRATVDPGLLKALQQGFAAQMRATVDPGLLKALQQGFAAQMRGAVDPGLLKALVQGFAAQTRATLDPGLLKALVQGFAAQERATLDPKLLKDLAAQAAAAFNQHQRAWKELNATVAVGFKLLEKTFEKAEMLGKLGWTLPMHASPAEYEELVKRIIDIRTADVEFTAFYTAEGGIRLEGLKAQLLACEDLKEWKAMLEEAFLDLEDGRFGSCVALVLPLVEGLTAIKFSAPRFHKKRERDKFFLSKLNAVRRGSLIDYAWRSYRGFAETLFQGVKFEVRLSKPATLKRHYLLHGRGIYNSNLSDCLRILQALQTITALR